MVSIKDKLAFFKKIIEDRVEEDFVKKTEQIQKRYATQREAFNAEVKLQMERLRHQKAYEAAKKERERQAKERSAVQSTIRQLENDGFAELLKECKETLEKTWNENPKAYYDSVLAALKADGAKTIHYIEGPARWQADAQKLWPEAEYTVVPDIGFVLYEADRAMRYDYSLDSLMRAQMEVLAAKYRTAMSDVLGLNGEV